MVFLQVTGARFVAGREFQAEAPVAVGLVPQIVQELDEDPVVGGPVQSLVEGAVGGEGFLAPLPRDGEQLPTAARMVTMSSSVRRSAASSAAVGSKDRRTSNS